MEVKVGVVLSGRGQEQQFSSRLGIDHPPVFGREDFQGVNSLCRERRAGDQGDDGGAQMDCAPPS